MGAARALERLHLLVHLQRAGDDDDGHKRQQLLELGQEIQAELALRQHVVEDQQVGPFAGNWARASVPLLTRISCVFGQGLLVDLVLEVVVFDDQDGWEWFIMQVAVQRTCPSPAG